MKNASSTANSNGTSVQRGKIHLIGHSLGAHIMGRAAKVLKTNEANSSDAWTADRVTGLDPAQPCFQTDDEELKLTKDDAPFVDVIHTNARSLLLFGLGLSQQLGNILFYRILIKIKFLRLHLHEPRIRLESKFTRNLRTILVSLKSSIFCLFSISRLPLISYPYSEFRF